MSTNFSALTRNTRNVATASTLADGSGNSGLDSLADKTLNRLIAISFKQDGPGALKELHALLHPREGKSASLSERTIKTLRLGGLLHQEATLGEPLAGMTETEIRTVMAALTVNSKSGEVALKDPWAGRTPRNVNETWTAKLRDTVLQPSTGKAF